MRYTGTELPSRALTPAWLIQWVQTMRCEKTMQGRGYRKAISRTSQGIRDGQVGMGQEGLEAEQAQG